jgi:hypothetical protein
MQVFVMTYEVILADTGTVVGSLMSLCAGILQVFCMKYLHIPTAVCVIILLYFCKNTCIYCAGFCAGFRAGFCAVASPSHRRRIAA